jgi:hypothetical protein
MLSLSCRLTGLYESYEHLYDESDKLDTNKLLTWPLFMRIFIKLVSETFKHAKIVFSDSQPKEQLPEVATDRQIFQHGYAEEFFYIPQSGNEPGKSVKTGDAWSATRH